jgi:phosphopantetheine binding protein
MRDKKAVLDRLIQLCDELGILPGGAAAWIERDIVEAADIDSMALVQLSAVVEEEFGIEITREDIVFVRTLDQLAARIAET